MRAATRFRKMTCLNRERDHLRVGIAEAVRRDAHRLLVQEREQLDPTGRGDGAVIDGDIDAAIESVRESNRVAADEAHPARRDPALAGTPQPSSVRLYGDVPYLHPRILAAEDIPM